MQDRANVVIPRPESRIFAGVAMLIWVGFLYYLAQLPRLPYVPFLPARAVSPLAHYGTFFVLASLAYLVAAPKPSFLTGRVRAVVATVALSIALALSLELLQYLLPDRVPQLRDFAYDVTGAVTGAIAMLFLDSLGIGQRALSSVAAGIVIVLVAMTGASIVIWNPIYPRVGDHWHASYQISICGTTLSPLVGTPGNVHTHGDARIHIHPTQPDEAGANATLALFLATSGGRLTDRSLTLPSGETYISGEQCPDGQIGQLAVTVNGDRLDKPASYVMRNRDEVTIEFKAGEDSKSGRP